jgi:hypothetical protein
MFCRSLFVLLYFFLWSLCCLSFNLRILMITPLVSSNSSHTKHVSNKLKNKLKKIQYQSINQSINIYSSNLDGVICKTTVLIIITCSMTFAVYLLLLNMYRLLLRFLSKLHAIYMLKTRYIHVIFSLFIIIII